MFVYIDKYIYIYTKYMLLLVFFSVVLIELFINVCCL